MSSSKLYSEIFDDFLVAPTRNEKINVLRRYGNFAFKEFLNLAFNPAIKFDAHIPDYKEAVEPLGLSYLYLESYVLKMYLYIQGHNRRPPSLSSKKQTQLLIVALESLHKSEAQLLVNLLKKDLKVKGLTPKIVKEAFPDLPFNP